MEKALDTDSGKTRYNSVDMSVRNGRRHRNFDMARGAPADTRIVRGSTHRRTTNASRARCSINASLGDVWRAGLETCDAADRWSGRNSQPMADDREDIEPDKPLGQQTWPLRGRSAGGTEHENDALHIASRMPREDGCVLALTGAPSQGP